jgi:hypothetical protein
MQKEDILAEIRRTAQENGGRPLGVGRFEKETGLKPYDWGKHWARFGDAQREAGFEPNTLQVAYDDDYLLEKIALLTRELGKFPTKPERRVKLSSDPSFPSANTFDRLGVKGQLVAKVLAYCADKAAYDDVIEILKSIPEAQGTDGDALAALGATNEQLGEVYLFKSGRHYKIGMTKDTVRRGNELRIQLPERMDLIHSIKTDDPRGIEAYWHRRFADKRMNGEWFDLNVADIRAFKRWRKIV